MLLTDFLAKLKGSILNQEGSKNETAKANIFRPSSDNFTVKRVLQHIRCCQNDVRTNSDSSQISQAGQTGDKQNNPESEQPTDGQDDGQAN